MNIDQSVYVSDAKLRDYLSENKLLLTFCILQYGIKSLKARWGLLEKKVSEFRDCSLAEFSPVDSQTEQISRRQIIHLDLLSSIFMFMEDFLGYSYNLRKPSQEFPKLIASRNYKTVEKEIALLEKLKKRDIGQFLLFPDLEPLSLDSNEKKIVNHHLQKISEDYLSSIKIILRFYGKYYRVYIKYKHIFTALLGFQSNRLDIPRKRVIIGGQIYIRDYNGNSKGFSTYILPNTSIECVEHYQEIIDRIRHVFYLLIYAYLSQMVIWAGHLCFQLFLHKTHLLQKGQRRYLPR